MKLLISHLVNFKLLITVTCLVVFLCGCAKQQLSASYYLIEYRPVAVNPALKFTEPLPFKVQVRNFKIPRSYDSVRIIARYSSHQINYYRYSLWAVRPHIAIADLLVAHINTYRIFKDCQREFLEERPDFEITGEIQQIEKFDSELYTAAHIKLRFELYDSSSKNALVFYDCDREVPIPSGNMSIFAKAISDLIQEETENFLVLIVEHFQPQTSDSIDSESSR